MKSLTEIHMIRIHMIKKYLQGILTILFFCPILTAFSALEVPDPNRQVRLREIILKLEKMSENETAKIRNYDVEIRKCTATIASAEAIVRKAKEAGNAKAEQVAGQALATAREAKRRNEELKRLAELNKGRIAKAMAYVEKGGANPEAALEQVEYENLNAQWVQKQKQLIEQRLTKPNPYVSEIYQSLKTNAPPALPDRKYEELKPGDVLLITPPEASLWNKLKDTSFWINLGDRATTDLKSPASHTVLYLKEVNGKKLFLDHTPERGSHVISEEEFLRTYGHRDALAASLAQPVKKEETTAIWEAARELSKKEAAIQSSKRDSIIFDQSGYGLYGDGNMVCSEASRRILVQSGRDIPESASPLKRLLGIDYGPANFFSDDYNFVITPLWAPAEK